MRSIKRTTPYNDCYDDKIAIAALGTLFVFILLIGVWIGADANKMMDECQKHHSYAVCIHSIEP